MDMTKAQPPLDALRYLERRFPKIWDTAAYARGCKGDSDAGDWPDYCWLPMSAWSAIVRLDVRAMPLAAAAGTWRLSKGIYDFDGDLAEELMSTPLSEETPTSVFFSLPEYGIYIPTPWNEKYSGMFAHLEYDLRLRPSRVHDPFHRTGPESGHDELRLLYLPREGDMVQKSMPAMLHIGPGVSVMGSLSGIYGQYSPEILRRVEEELSLLLYLCSSEPDYGDRQPPAYHEPKKIKGRYKWIPAQKITEWEVGVRLGAAIRGFRASERRGSDSEPTGRTVRPHIRRAHWHGYWTGPRREAGGQKFVYKWIPPVPVNAAAGGEGFPAVVRAVF